MINPYSFITPNHLFPNLSVSSTLAVWMISGPPVPGGSNRQSLIRQSSLCICLYSRAINLTQGHHLSTTITLRPVSLDQSSRAVDLNKGLRERERETSAESVKFTGINTHGSWKKLRLTWLLTFDDLLISTSFFLHWFGAYF